MEEGAVMVSHVLHTCCDVPSRSLSRLRLREVLCPCVPVFQGWLSLPHSLLGTRDSRHGEGHRAMAQSLETGPLPWAGCQPTHPSLCCLKSFGPDRSAHSVLTLQLWEVG